MYNNDEVFFSEIQYFRQVWLTLFISFSTILVWTMAISQFVFKHPLGNNPAPDSIMIIIWILSGIISPLFFLTSNLKTEVKKDGFYFQFFPFHMSPRKISVEDIKSYEARTYNPIRDYGGWGIRSGRNGNVYNMNGNKGLYMELKDGKRILFGSQKSEELAGAIDRIKK
jgi:hypothetical protein